MDENLKRKVINRQQCDYMKMAAYARTPKITKKHNRSVELVLESLNVMRKTYLSKLREQYVRLFLVQRIHMTKAIQIIQ